MNRRGLSLQDTLYQAFQSEPKPITETRVMEIAKATLPHIEYDQFGVWMKKHGATLLGMLNG